MVKQFSFFATLMVYMMNTGFAQEVLPLYQKNIPYSKGVSLKEIYTVSDGGHQILRNVSVPTITVYLPKAQDKPLPAVIIFPGGGYSVLAYDHEGAAVAKALNEKGIAAFVVHYRLPNDSAMTIKEKVPLADAQQAISRVRRGAKTWGLDTHRIGIMGFSAGGHLAATAGVHFLHKHKNPRPDFMVLVYPVISFSDSIGHRGSRENLIGKNVPQALIDYYSTELHITPNTPPTYLIHAKDDKAVPVANSTVFYNVLKSNGVEAQLYLFEKGGHGFGLENPQEPAVQWLDNVVSWIHNLNTK